MPTYEYACAKCGQHFDAFQSMRDEPFRECPKELCQLPKWGHGKVKRLLGTGAVSFSRDRDSTLPIIGASRTKRRPKRSPLRKQLRRAKNPLRRKKPRSRLQPAR